MKILKLLAVTGVTILALSGCAANGAGAQATLESFYSSSIESGQSALETLQNTEGMSSILDEEALNSLNSAEDPIVALQELSDEDQQKVLEYYQEADNTDEYINFENMTKPEQVSLHILNLLTASFYTTVGEGDFKAVIESDSVKESDGAATFNTSDLTYTLDGNAFDAAGLASVAPAAITLQDFDGEWKIVGKQLLESYQGF